MLIMPASEVDTYIAHRMELAWAAGYLSARGSLATHTPYGKLRDGSPRAATIRLQFMSLGPLDDLWRIARVTNIPVSPKREKQLTRQGYQERSVMRVTGATLHDLMLLLWPMLSEHRREEYNRLRSQVGREVIS